ncbi:MAG: hypothetical protein M0R21_04325 [Lentimicrobiaceae bacterium]|nr:hypothetical protein [Lentimicrobiaceae bacterium]
MDENNKIVARKYYAQAEYFIVAAELASKHSKTKFNENPVAYKNFEIVIVGTHHAFSAELLIKGIMFFHKGNHPKCHEIKDLLNHESCRKLKETIKNEFQPKIHISYSKELLETQLNQYLNNLDKKDKFENKEIETLNKIISTFEFGSFDYFLELHSNHFVKMRYACEKDPPPLDMNFTSFLNERLRTELKKLLRL